MSTWQLVTIGMALFFLSAGTTYLLLSGLAWCIRWIAARIYP